MLTLSSRRAGKAARRLGEAAPLAAAMGFASVHAAVPPTDAATARAALEAVGVSLAGVSTEPVADLRALDAALDHAAAAARVLREPRVILDLGPYAGARGETREVSVEGLARALHAAYRRFGGVTLSVRAGAQAGTLLGLVETEWLLDALAGEGLSTWLDPWRAAHAGPEGGERRPLEWAARLARRVTGIALEGEGSRGEGHGLPEEGALDWSTLAGLLPSRAVRVLDVGPAESEAAVVEVRRRLEDEAGF